ncbi:Protein kinase C conserved region 2 [Fragilaria crotonensis]|nr:Protein kinase C conserved region 2 [Fragilaria crotonensis]
MYGKSRQKILKISANEGHEEAVAYEEAWQKREQDDMKKAEKRAEMERVLQEHGNESIHTQVNLGIPLDLLERLGRYQGYIGSVCQFFRQVKIILLWEESILSFWISALFLGAGLVSLLLPWVFILTWTGRIVVYGLFGPHMKIVDLWLRANKSDELEQIMNAFDAKKQIVRIRREQALKVRAVKCLRFGKLITQVPAFNLARHYDRPLPSSTAKVIRKAPAIECTSVLAGQQLYGDMIPRLEDKYQSNEALALERMEKLSRVETRLTLMQAAAKLSGGVRRHRHLRLKQASSPDETAPCEVGYELVQVGDKSHSQLMMPTETELTSVTSAFPSTTYLALDGMNGKASDSNDDPTYFEQISNQSRTAGSFSVKSRQKEDDDDEYASSPASISERLLEDTKEGSCHALQLELSDGECVLDFESEGVEIVALERVHQDDEDAPVDESSLPKGSLSVLYKESDSTFVAFYRE